MTGAERWTFVLLRWLSTISAIAPSGSGSTRAIWPTCPGKDNTNWWSFCTQILFISRILSFEHSLSCRLWLVHFWSFVSSHWPEAKFLDEILRVFLLVIHSHLYSFAWDFHFSKLTQPLTVSVKEKGGKPDRKPFPLPYGLRNPYRNLQPENYQDYAQKPQLDCTFMNSASGLWRRLLCVCRRSMACPTLLTWSSPPATTSTRRPSCLSTSRCESRDISRQFLQSTEDEQDITQYRINRFLFSNNSQTETSVNYNRWQVLVYSIKRDKQRRHWVFAAGLSLESIKPECKNRVICYCDMMTNGCLFIKVRKKNIF